MRSPSATLPDFIVIGAMRAGTTTMYRCLADHPEIGLSAEKETDYFLEHKYQQCSRHWYHQQFCPGFKIYGEVSPNYSKARDFPGVPPRIIAAIPRCKFIYIVRDPIERFVSQYNHTYFSGKVLPEPDKLFGHHEWHHILDASLYFRQLSEYLNITSLESILVIEFETFIQRPQLTLKEVEKFLGVSDHVWTEATGMENSSQDLAKIPPWLLRMRTDPILVTIRRRLPKGIVRLIRRRVAAMPRRQVPPFSQQLREIIAAGVRDDVNKLRELTGLRLRSWSV